MKNMKVLNRFFIAILCLSFASCGPNYLSDKDIIEWMENSENKLRQTKNETNVSYVLQFKNVDYVLAKKGDIMDPEFKTEEFRDEISDKLLFDLYVTCNNGSESPLQYNSTSNEEVNSRYYYYQFRFINDIHIEYENSQIEPLYCIADKGSGLNNTMAFSIGFEKKDIGDKDFKVVIDDKILGVGTTKFLYKNNYLTNLPKLKI